MQQNTLSDEIERELEHFNKFYGAMFECGDFDSLYADIKQSLRSIAKKTIEAVRIKRDCVAPYELPEEASRKYGNNLAVTTFEEKTSVWLREE